MIRKEKGITLGILSIAVISMAIILILALIKVYLSNRIYHESKEINHIEAEVAALKEEQSILQMKVERLKYKNRITDTIFSMDEDRQITEAQEEKRPVKPIDSRALWGDTE